MSKKIAGGSDAIVLDVKTGAGAFMKTLEEARALARAMVSIGNRSAGGDGRHLRMSPSAMWSATPWRKRSKPSGRGPKDLEELCLTWAASGDARRQGRIGGGSGKAEEVLLRRKAEKPGNGSRQGGDPRRWTIRTGSRGRRIDPGSGKGRWLRRSSPIIGIVADDARRRRTTKESDRFVSLCCTRKSGIRWKRGTLATIHANRENVDEIVRSGTGSDRTGRKAGLDP